MSRFVDRRAALLMRRLEAGDGQQLLSAVTRRGEVVVEGHPVGHVGGLTFFPDPGAAGEEKKMVMRAARRALREEMPRRVAAAECAETAAFTLTPEHRLLWDGQAIARLRPGKAVLRPLIEVLDSEFLDGAQRERLRTRLQRFLDERVEAELAPLFVARERASGDPALRGALHRLSELVGVLPGAGNATLDPPMRARLKAIGVKAGRFALFVPALLKPRAAALRAQLWTLQRGLPVPELPPAGTVSLAPPAWPGGLADALGWIEAGPVLLRLDVAERIAADLAWASRRGATALPSGLPSRLSIRQDVLPVVLRRLGFRVVPGEALSAGQHGPPAPPMFMPLRRRPPAAAPPPEQAAAHGPFAALASLRP